VSGGIEDTILSNIEANTGDDFGDSGVGAMDEQTGAPGSDPEQDQAEQQLARRVERPQDAPKRPPVPGKPEQPQQTTPKGKPITPNVQAAEQRVNQQIARLRQVNQDYQRKEADLNRRLAETSALNQLPQQFGLQNQEVIEGLQFIVDLKQNPVAAAQKMIQAALTRGANLRDIVNDEMVPQLSLRATQQLLDERLGPVQQQRQDQEHQERVQREAATGANQFLADYPDAAAHTGDIAQLMLKIAEEYAGRGIQLPPAIQAEKAWERIVGFAHQNGFDLSQPLGPQYQARNQQPAQARTRPMPNGVSGGGAPMTSRSARPSRVSESFDSIVREAMRENGYNIN
jgi:hypothetical protein